MEDPDTPACTWNIHDTADCGADASTERDGFPVCADHAALWDELVREAAILPPDF